MIVTLTLVSAHSVGAEEVTVPTTVSTPTAGSLEYRAKVDAQRTEMERKRDEYKKEYEAGKLELKDKRIEFKNEIEAKKAEMDARRDELKNRASTTRDKITERREEVKKLASTTRNEIQNRVIETLSKRIEKTAEQLSKAVERLGEIAKKIDSRLTKFAEKGVDVTKARADLVIAQTKISAVAVSAKAVADITVSTDNPKSSLETLKFAVDTTKKEIKDAHAALVSIVNSLKPAVGTATSTSEQ